jgi:aminoglycoside phosphotransferase (APT) family kinase protein
VDLDHAGLMVAAGPLLARGRDADIYAFGDTSVLKRDRHGRSLAGEAAVLSHVHRWGAPVPAVHDVTDDGELVMERVYGPSLLADLRTRPWRLRAAARTLAQLHAAVHHIPPPPGVGPSGLPGDQLLHLDLHPMNILLADDGPVLIDWTNVRTGPGSADLAMTWIIMATADIDAPRPVRALFAPFRRGLVKAFLSEVDRESAEAVLPAVAEWKLADPNILPIEVERLRHLCDRYLAR